jgi:uncharacterized protein YbjT (DUF2867 family)
MMKQPSLVVGATGLLGGEIVRLLREAGKPARALVRSTCAPPKRDQLERQGTELVVGDLKTRDSLLAACKSIGTVVSTASASLSRQPGDSIATVDDQGQLALIEAAEQCGVDHFVFVSFAPLRVDCALQRAKRTVEARLRQSKMSFTILQPVDFMEVWLSPALGFDPVHGRVRIFGTGEQPVSWVSMFDVARFAVAATENDGFARRTLALGGPDALSPLQVVKIFEELRVQKSELEFVPEAMLEAQVAGSADAVQEAFAAIMLSTARGYTADPREAVGLLPGRLRSVREYATEVVKNSKVDGG